jgi:hypothetical protein
MILGPSVLLDGADCAAILTDLTALLWRHAEIPTPAIANLLAEIAAANGADHGGENVTPRTPGRTLTVTQYHQLTGTPKRTVRDWCDRGELTADKAGGRIWLIHPRSPAPG